jgi:hypothetical protein
MSSRTDPAEPTTSQHRRRCPPSTVAVPGEEPAYRLEIGLLVAAQPTTTVGVQNARPDHHKRPAMRGDLGPSARPSIGFSPVSRNCPASSMDRRAARPAHRHSATAGPTQPDPRLRHRSHHAGITLGRPDTDILIDQGNGFKSAKFDE